MYNTAENHEEIAILEAAVDPLEWKQELDRVYRDLVNIEKDIEVLAKEGGDSFTPEFEEYKRHLDLILNMSKEIQSVSTPEVRKVFANSAEYLEETLSFIRRNEIRINKLN